MKKNNFEEQQRQTADVELPQQSSHTAEEIHFSSQSGETEKSLSFVPKKRWRKSAEEFVKALSEGKTSPKENICTQNVSQVSLLSVKSKKESAKRPR